jgi:hypothetical protein
MRTLASILFAFVVGLTSLLVAPQSLAQDSFSQEQKADEIKKLQTDIDHSRKIAGVNQGWDISFKVALLVLAIAAAGGTAYLAALGQVTPPSWLKISNLVLTSATAALSTFAYTQFDFAKRQTVWRERTVQLESCQDALRYLNPNPEEFLRQVKDIRKWGDSTAVTELTAACIGSRKGPTVPASANQPAAPASK